jgi:hypothetical protein
MYPASAERFLAPRPETFPVPLVHAANETKSETFESAQYFKLFGGRLGQ